MEAIKFPGLGLEFNVSQVAINIADKIEIYWYAIFIVLGIILSLIILKKRSKLFNINYEDIINLALWLLPICIIGARLYYILFNIDFYLSKPSRILNIRNGGLAIYGGIIAGIITCYIYCKKKKINFLDLIDALAPCLALGQAIGRWGNFVNVEAYGIQTTLPWRMGIIEAGKYVEVHPTFLYESIATAIIFIILITKKDKRKFKGQIACIYLLLYSIERFIVEGLRTDSLIVGNIRISQLISIIIFIISAIILLKNTKKSILKRENKMSKKEEK